VSGACALLLLLPGGLGTGVAAAAALGDVGLSVVAVVLAAVALRGFSGRDIPA
jgi:hypothetical protein